MITVPWHSTVQIVPSSVLYQQRVTQTVIFLRTKALRIKATRTYWCNTCSLASSSFKQTVFLSPTSLLCNNQTKAISTSSTRFGGTKHILGLHTLPIWPLAIVFRAAISNQAISYSHRLCRKPRLQERSWNTCNQSKTLDKARLMQYWDLIM